ncbi:unnamed protein product, partial [Meganyctiphanes norvegica]
MIRTNLTLEFASSGYAAASLFALLCAIPFTHRVLTHETGRWTSYYVAFFHAHIVLYFGNSCVGIGVLMLLALTVERFLSVCYPAKARNICGGTRAYVTVVLIPVTTFLLYIPTSFWPGSPPAWTIKSLPLPGLGHHLPGPSSPGDVVFHKKRNQWLIGALWFQAYKLGLELVFKLVPSIILVYLNVRIMKTYKAVCKRRRTMVAQESKEQRRHFQEESRLMFLLGGTTTLFFVCMTPMIILSVTIHWTKMDSFPFQIFRATANVLEVTNFAVTFYIYCMFSKDFRETFVRCMRRAKDNPHSL